MQHALGRFGRQGIGFLPGLFVEGPGQHRVQLLEGLLTSLPTRPTDPTLQAAVQQLGFEIISQEAVAGRTKTLHLLRKLLPHDRLLPGDASRYAARLPSARQ